MLDEHGVFKPNLPAEFLSKSRDYPALPFALRDFIMRFQTECVVECCGIDAFIFRAPTLDDLAWARENNIGQVLEVEIARAEKLAAEVISIREINQLLAKDDWLCHLRHLANSIQS